jgi:P-aminobenzoate N-oxygenase AurF
MIASAPARDYQEQVRKLNRASVKKYYRAFHDIDWDAPENQLERGDPRLALRASSPLGQSDWYRALPAAQRAELGLEMTCQVFKLGLGFESVLSSGLLNFARALPNRMPEHRYALHELIEESQHTLMFQEFIDRSGTDPVPAGALDAFVDRRVMACAVDFPELFFFCVLAGEIFIDDDQRAWLREVEHPLLARVLQIHVTEEARHVRFAELYLREHLPQLSPLRRRFLRAVLPRVYRDAQRMMLMPHARVTRRFAIPHEVLRRCYGHGSAHRERVERVAAPVLALLDPELRVF